MLIASRRFAPRAASFAVALGLASLGACATKEAAEAPIQYKVLKADASIPFGSSNITGFGVGDDNSLIVNTIGRTYRATLDRFCQDELPWQFTIAFVDRGMPIDRFSTVLIDNQRCRIMSLDEIEDPAKTARRLREEGANAPPASTPATPPAATP